jgi:hypothetical protein
MAEQASPQNYELIFIVKPDSAIRHTINGFKSDSASPAASQLQAILDEHSVKTELLFGLSEDRLRSRQAGLQFQHSSDEKVAEPTTNVFPDLASFYRVEGSLEKLDKLAKSLLANDTVDAAYVRPPVALPFVPDAKAITLVDAPATTPNFVGHQGYLGPAPAGIDVDYASTIAGGRGRNVGIVDCEHGWRFTHEDLLYNKGGVISGTNAASNDHGTAVIGAISGDLNAIGITGIAPDAIISGSSWSTLSTATAIMNAANYLRPGDLLLLEGHLPGPRATDPTGQTSQFGFIPIEWWPDILTAIRYAVARGIVVIEAGGNGSQNLDDGFYDTAPASYGFPSWWKNPLNDANAGSGAVLVGAGAPPPGTHGRNWGPDRSRLDFSNYGSRIDAQGWGREVTSTGYGDLQNGVSQDHWYTDTFSGTSSASPIVTGALACVQGARKAAARRLITSEQARTLLRRTGSLQQAGSFPVSQRIGNRPNLRQAIPSAMAFP